MVKNLAWIAAGGLSVGVVCLSLAYAIGRDHMNDLADLGFSLGRSCDSNSANVDSTKSERRWTWNGGDTIDIAVPATVHFRSGEGDEVIARGSPDAISHIEVGGGRITFYCRGGGSRSIDITLPGRDFRHVGISGSGNVVMENVNQPDLTLRISGSGTLRAQGTSDHVTVKISGAGRARLADLAMKQLTVDISGSGNIEAAPKDVADINVSGSGNVKLFSHPVQLRSHVTGSGRITQAEGSLR
jgi:hypothetical protein